MGATARRPGLSFARPARPLSRHKGAAVPMREALNDPQSLPKRFLAFKIVPLPRWMREESDSADFSADPPRWRLLRLWPKRKSPLSRHWIWIKIYSPINSLLKSGVPR